VEASFFLDFLDTFSSRKKYQIFFAPMESLGPQARTNILVLACGPRQYYETIVTLKKTINNNE
jgi:hypothetical protein